MIKTDEIIKCNKMYMKNFEYNTSKKNKYTSNKTTINLYYVLWEVCSKVNDVVEIIKYVVK